MRRAFAPYATYPRHRHALPAIGFARMEPVRTTHGDPPMHNARQRYPGTYLVGSPPPNERTNPKTMVWLPPTFARPVV